MRRNERCILNIQQQIFAKKLQRFAVDKCIRYANAPFRFSSFLSPLITRRTMFTRSSSANTSSEWNMSCIQCATRWGRYQRIHCRGRILNGYLLFPRSYAKARARRIRFFNFDLIPGNWRAIILHYSSEFRANNAVSDERNALALNSYGNRKLGVMTSNGIWTRPLRSKWNYEFHSPYSRWLPLNPTQTADNEHRKPQPEWSIRPIVDSIPSPLSSQTLTVSSTPPHRYVLLHRRLLKLFPICSFGTANILAVQLKSKESVTALHVEWHCGFPVGASATDIFERAKRLFILPNKSNTRLNRNNCHRDGIGAMHNSPH